MNRYYAGYNQLNNQNRIELDNQTFKAICLAGIIGVALGLII